MLRLSNVDEGKPQNIVLKLREKPTLSALLNFASLYKHRFDTKLSKMEKFIFFCFSCREITIEGIDRTHDLQLRPNLEPKLRWRLDFQRFQILKTKSDINDRKCEEKKVKPL